MIDLLFYSATILSYCIGVGMNRHLDLLLRERTAARWIAVPVPICCLAVDLFRFFLGPSRWYVCFVALACGCVNVVSSKICGVVTNAVTGNLQRCSNALFDLCVGRLDEAARRQALETLLVVVSMLAGVGGSVTSASCRAAARSASASRTLCSRHCCSRCTHCGLPLRGAADSLPTIARQLECQWCLMCIAPMEIFAP